jgi:ATP-GRASP peptide maturase of grasp-with-spasm system
MIIIFSQITDNSTNDIVDWLTRFNKECIRLNPADEDVKLEHIDLEKNEIVFNVQGKKIDILKAKSIWYRRRGLGNNLVKTDMKSLKGKNIYIEKEGADHTSNHLKDELGVLLEFIFYKLEKEVPLTLGSKFKADPNKFVMLEVARKHGLKIPETLVATTREQIKEMLHSRSAVINKALSNGVYYFAEHHGYYTYTEKISEEFVDTLPDNIFPALVQPQIRKNHELRVFYLKGAFYPMAIFSQISRETQVDFRRSGREAETLVRYVPFRLPDHLKTSLQNIMDDLGMDTGSIDLIVDDKGDYYFLEVNHVGQFGWLSLYCNYYLEKKIAEVL